MDPGLTHGSYTLADRAFVGNEYYDLGVGHAF